MEQKMQNLPVKRELTEEAKKAIQENPNYLMHSQMKRVWQENPKLSVQEAIAEVEQFAQAMGL